MLLYLLNRQFSRFDKFPINALCLSFYAFLAISAFKYQFNWAYIVCFTQLQTLQTALLIVIAI